MRPSQTPPIHILYCIFRMLSMLPHYLLRSHLALRSDPEFKMEAIASRTCPTASRKLVFEGLSLSWICSQVKPTFPPPGGSQGPADKDPMPVFDPHFDQKWPRTPFSRRQVLTTPRRASRRAIWHHVFKSILWGGRAGSVGSRNIASFYTFDEDMSPQGPLFGVLSRVIFIWFLQYIHSFWGISLNFNWISKEYA